MASAPATAAVAQQGALRIVSRRAQLLLQRHKQKQQQGGNPSASTTKTSSIPPKPEETPWPPSIRYTFYTLCVASVPFAIGQAFASSPKLREYVLGEDVDVEKEISGGETDGVVSSKNILSLVRGYWGHEEYVPPIDRLPLKHATPGYRHAWQEDNFSSALQMLGLYSRTTTANSNNTATPDDDTSEEGGSIPMSLDNEPPFHIRHDQKILSQYLSTTTNPWGVKTRLTLLPYASASSSSDDDMDNIAGYDTICTLPANLTMNSLRALCKGSNAQAMKRDLAEKSDLSFLSKSMCERIRTYCWREDCRWVVTFPDDDDKNALTLDDVIGNDVSLDSSSHEYSLQKASDVLRHNTSIYSSWNYFPEASGISPTAALASTLGTPSAAAKKGGGTIGSSNTVTTSSRMESLQIQKLQYDIAELERELKDPSSLRDRDSMYEELRLAKRELRKLKPWWRRIW
jgi:hypothetical protein